MPVLTGQFPNHLAEGIVDSFNLMGIEAMKKPISSKICDVYDTTDYSEDFTSDEGIDEVQELTEDGEIKEATLGEGYKITAISREFAQGLKISKKVKLRMKDKSTQFFENFMAKKELKLINSHLNKVEEIAHVLLNDGFGDAITPQLAPDASPIFGLHTFKSTGRTFNNQIGSLAIGSTSFPGTGNVLSDTSWKLIQKYGGAFTDANGFRQTVDFKTVVVKKGSTQSFRARSLFGIGKRTAPQTPGDVNIFEVDGVQIIESPWVENERAESWFAYDQHFDLENPLAVKFISRPSMDPMIPKDNGSSFFPTFSSFEAFCRNLPMNWVGYNGK